MTLKCYDHLVTLTYSSSFWGCRRGHRPGWRAAPLYKVGCSGLHTLADLIIILLRLRRLGLVVMVEADDHPRINGGRLNKRRRRFGTALVVEIASTGGAPIEFGQKIPLLGRKIRKFLSRLPLFYSNWEVSFLCNLKNRDFHNNEWKGEGKKTKWICIYDCEKRRQRWKSRHMPW